MEESGKEDSSKQGLLVEFLGLPRAGKSTLSHRVAEMLAAGGLAADVSANYPQGFIDL